MRAQWLAPLLLLAGGLSLAFQGIGVAPPRSELRLSPGEQKNVKVKVFTTEEGPLQVSARFMDWKLTPEGGVVELPPGENPYSAASWLQADLDPFEISAGQYREIRIRVNVPNDPHLEGSYWAAVHFVTTPPNQNPQNKVIFRVAANYIVYVTIAGTEKPNAQITRFERNGNTLFLDIENTGNTYLRLEGEIRFLNAAGEITHTLKLPERVVLREGLARMRLRIPKDAIKDAVVAVVEVWAKKPVPLPKRLYAEVPLQ